MQSRLTIYYTRRVRSIDREIRVRAIEAFLPFLDLPNTNVASPRLTHTPKH
jgi:hypothetical protein